MSRRQYRSSKFAFLFAWITLVVYPICSLGEAATQPSLKDIEYRHSISMAGFSRIISISSSGAVRVVTYRLGQKDVLESGQIEQKKLAELAELFKGWEKLDNFYSGVPDGPDYAIRYGDKTVCAGGGEDTPEQFEKVRQKLEALAGNLETEQDGSL